MIKYKILVKNPDGEYVGEFNKFRNLTFNKRLNNYGTCSFDVPIIDIKINSLIALRRFSVEIWREDNGSKLLLWAGEQASLEGNLDKKGGNWATLTSFDWLELLNSRFTADEVFYEQIDAGQIAWDLIDDTQNQTNGDYGITEGVIEATMPRDREYFNKNILECIIELSNVINGFDFEINNSKVFNVKNVIGVDRSDDVILEYGVNIISMRITQDFTKITNRAIVLGDSGYVEDPLRLERNDEDAQDLYKVREAVISEMTVVETESLEEKGDALIRKYATPLYKVSMDISKGGSPSIADFSYGDIIKMKVKRGIYNINENFRVFEWRVNYGNKNTEKLDLVLGNFYLPDFS